MWAGGAKADDQIFLAGVGAEQVDVFRGKAGVEKALLHGRRAGGDIAQRRIGGVDLDELLEDGAGKGAILRRCGGQARGICARAGWRRKLRAGALKRLRRDEFGCMCEL